MSGQMADNKTPPKRIHSAGNTSIQYDLVAGSLRCVPRLFVADPTRDIKAIWRNEIGKATVTGPRAAS
jgi:hypothetical protein